MFNLMETEALELDFKPSFGKLQWKAQTTSFNTHGVCGVSQNVFEILYKLVHF